jgi:flagellin-like protein
MMSFSRLNIKHDTFKSARPPLQKTAAKAARKDKTMKSVIRKDEAAVSPVIATILMVAITVVLAAVLYVMVSGLITPVGGNKPLVEFSSVDQSASVGNATFSVLSASQTLGPASYKVNLQVGTFTGALTSMPTTSGGSVSITVNSIVYRIYWTDLGGGTVNAGDTLRVTGNGVALGAGSYTFHLLWSDDSLIRSVSWSKS